MHMLIFPSPKACYLSLLPSSFQLPRETYQENIIQIIFASNQFSQHLVRCCLTLIIILIKSSYLILLFCLYIKYNAFKATLKNLAVLQWQKKTQLQALRLSEVNLSIITYCYSLLLRPLGFVTRGFVVFYINIIAILQHLRFISIEHLSVRTAFIFCFLLLFKIQH